MLVGSLWQVMPVAAQGIPPTVTTDGASNVAGTSATFIGTLSSLGTASTVNVSFQWGLSSGNHTNETSGVSMNVTGAFNTTIARLDPGTLYYFRAKAVGEGTSYGVERSFATLPPPLLRQWGSFGSGDGQFAAPSDVAADASGNVYVTDSYNHRIQKFTGSGEFITKWGSFGSDNAQFNFPAEVAVDSAGDVYIVDLYNHRIQKFTGSGEFITRWGSFGSADNQFSFPWGIALDSAGSVYVADSYNHRIQKFTSSGEFITRWGTEGSGNGQFSYPAGVAVDWSDNVYVTDSYNYRLQKFTSSGEFITTWGSEGSGDGQFNIPMGVAADSAGNVYVADMYNHRIQKFTSSGEFIARWGTEGSGDGQFSYPTGVAIDSSDDIYIADFGNHRIQVFGASAAPIVITGDATNITSDSASLNGELRWLGITPTANVSFLLGLSSGNYTLETAAVSMNATGPFSANLNSLSANTIYYFRAKAVDEQVAYGIEKSFTTTLPPTLVSIQVSPAKPVIPLGAEQQFTAIGTYTDNSTANLTDTVTWSSSNTTVATINATGLVTSLAEGTTTITATLEAIAGSTTLIVRKSQLVSISVTPASPSIALGLTQQFNAMATYADNSTENMTTLVIWSSSNTTVAGISTTGLATSLGKGTTTITATLGAVTGSAVLKVTPSVLLSISVSPPSVSVAAGGSRDFTATGNFTDRIEDITNGVLWSSSNTSIASVQDIGEPNPGRATGLKPGKVTITATYFGVSGTVSLEVTPAVLENLTVAPANPVIFLHDSKQFRALGTYSDGSVIDKTASAAWSSSNTSVATIKATGLAASLAEGTTTITAALAGLSDNSTLTVTSELQAIRLYPSDPPAIPAGQRQRFWAIGLLSDGSEAVITDNITWTSSNTTVAWINPAGIAASYVAGTTVITAVSGNVSGNTTLTVDPVILKFIQVTPISPTIIFVSGAPPQLQFIATGINSDFSTTALTANATWSSSKPEVAIMETVGQANPGLATTVVPGTTLITASFGGISGNSTFTVEPDTVAPVVTLSRPSPGLILSSANLTVMGNVDDVSAAAGIVVNGGTPIPVTLDAQGNFSKVVTLNADPARPVSNTIRVVAIDIVGNIGVSGTRTVVVDSRKPDISITQPREGLLTSNPLLTVTVNITNATSATLIVNGVSRPVTVVGTAFAANVTLTEGTNIIVVNAYAAGYEGNPAYLGSSGVRTVVLDITPPVINISSPISGSVVTTAGYWVLGYIDDFAVTTANLTLNGGVLQSMAVVGRIFHQHVTLAEGSNTVTVVAVDKAGNLSTASVNVTFDKTRPDIMIARPLNNPPVRVASQLVSGGIFDPTITEATLYLNGVPEKVTVAPDSSFARMVTLETGLNTLEVRATDATGYEGTSGVLKVPLDITPPRLTIGLTDPADSIIITVTSDERLFEPLSVFVATDDVVTHIAVDQWTGVFQPIPPGEYTVGVVGIDWAGNPTIATASFTKRLVTIGQDETGEVGTETVRLKITPKADVVNAPVALTSTTENPSGNVRNPPEAPVEAGAFLEVVTSPEVRDNLAQMDIKVHYDEKQLPPGTDETTLKLYLWDVVSGTWKEVPSRVMPDQDYIEATVSELSKYGTFGKRAVPPTEPPTQPPVVDVGPTEPPIVPGVTEVSAFVTAEGKFVRDATAKSEDGKAWLAISKDTIGKTKEGLALSQINVIPIAVPPVPPSGSRAIGLAYDLGPDGATFSSPITVTLSYDPVLIPSGVAEGNLVIAMHDKANASWINLASVVDKVTQTLSAKVNHFTAFTILSYTRPAAFTVSNLKVSPTEVDVGQIVFISVLVTNVGDLTGSYEVTLKISDTVVETREVTLAGGVSQTVIFTNTPNVGGTFTVNVDTLSGIFTARIPPEPPALAAFTTTGLTISPTEVGIGERVTISVLVTNTGELSGSYAVTLKISDVVVDTKDVTLDGGASQTVVFTAARDVAGNYTVTIGALSGTFTVTTPPVVPVEMPPALIAWWVWLIVGLVGVAVIAVVVWLVMRRRTA